MTVLRQATRTPRFQQRLVTVNDLRLHYAEVPGDGPPLVMLHGIGMDWRVWQAISRRFAPYYHLYLLDLRGHGQSEKPLHGYTLPHYAADVEEIIDRLGLRGVTLVGSSLGGMVAAVVEAPADIVTYRVLADPPLTGGPVRDAEMFARILVLKHEPEAALTRYLQSFNPGTSPHFLRVMSRMWHEAADGVIEDMLDRPTDYWDVTPALEHIESPTLLLQADPAQGGVLTTPQAEQTLRDLPHGKLVDVPGAGHAIHAYKPAEFVDLVGEFSGVTKGLGGDRGS